MNKTHFAVTLSLLMTTIPVLAQSSENSKAPLNWSEVVDASGNRVIILSGESAERFRNKMISSENDAVAVRNSLRKLGLSGEITVEAETAEFMSSSSQW